MDQQEGPIMTSQDALVSWEENGYVAVENVLTGDELVTLRKAVDELPERASHLTESTDRFVLGLFGSDSTTQIQQVAEPHELGGVWMGLARHFGILDVVAKLIGPNIQLYYSMMMMKPPGQGAPAPWHQDIAFFPHDRAALVAAQIYLDDSTLDNGCIRVVPGSHKLGLLNHYDDGVFTGVVEGDTSDFDAQEVALPMKAGGMLLWHSMTLHSSHPNTSPHPRRAVVFEFKDPSARLLHGSFAKTETRAAGLMLRGRDPNGELLSAI
jgi:ectoine hydroxylase-related dioxygenase (phytanoyl-CoA dioxygenase family)